MIPKHSSILVTGASGLLGRYIIDALIHHKYDNITILVRESSNLAHIEDHMPLLVVKYGDITDIGSLQEALEGIDYVIHSAGLVTYHPNRRKQLYAVNSDGSANLGNLCLEMGIKKLVHISSIAALGRSSRTNEISESTMWKESSFNTDYARSKYLGEQEMWRCYHEGLPVSIINPSIILGIGNWHQSSLAFIPRTYKGNKYFPTGVTGFVHARDVAEAAVKALESKHDGERFIISSENLPFEEVLSSTAYALDKNPPTRPLTPTLLRIGVIVEKIRSWFGAEPLITKQTALSSMSKSYYDNSKSIKKLGIKYRDIESTILEVSQAYLEDL